MPGKLKEPKHYPVEIGKTYGYLKVLKKVEPYEKINDNGNRVDFREQYLCECQLCEEKTKLKVQSRLLVSGRKKSCGCIRNHWAEIHPPIKHGLTHDKLHAIWLSIRDRCKPTTKSSKKDYFDRGIRVCEEWNRSDGFINFYEWAIKNGYKPGLSIERIDVNGNYCPENCKWIEPYEQSFNKTNSIYIELNGEKVGLARFCRENGLNLNLIRRRYHRNLPEWTIEEILYTPKGKRPKRLIERDKNNK